MNLAATAVTSADVPTVPIATLEADPHGVFRQYRKQVPFIMRSDGAALVLRNADVLRLPTDPRTRQAETEFAKVRGIEDGTLLDFFKYSMLTSNGDAHRRRRSAFSTAFAFRAIAALRPHIRKVADDLISEWQTEGEIDFLDRYASQLPARLVGHILGMPREDIPVFTKLVYTSTRVLSVQATRSDLPEIENASKQLVDYIERLCSARRAAPRDDFLSAYIAAADQAGEMSPIELLMQILTVVSAGSDTTRGALAIQTALLLEHREQWNAVCSDPSLVPAAVAEALRFEPSVGSFNRFALEDIELDSHVLKAGQFMQLSTMSAMRDEHVFQNPDVFDIGRTDQQRWHLVFGAGAHRCLGEALARTELEEGLAALTARIPNLQVSGEPLEVRGHVSIRRMGDMRVQWSLCPG
jgi:cytochrome P450